MTKFSSRGLAVSAAILSLCAYAAPASAQATRTWVSGVGDDVNPCSRTAPCKTFAGAISKTAAGGEINCLDPGGFGAVTITKSMTIDCHYTEGGELAGGNGIVVNAGAADVVVLRGLDIFGVNPPSNGVRFLAGGALHIEDCVIRRFNAANSRGISFAPSGTSALYITDTTISENGNGATGGGILVQPGVAGNAKVTMKNVRVLNNANNAVEINTTGNTAFVGLIVTMDDINIAGSTNGLSVITANSTNPIGLMLLHSTIASNSGTGINVSGPNGTARVGDTTVTGNALGVSVAGGSILSSFGTNRVFSNPHVGAANNGTFTPPIVTQN